ncbi:MAG: undecaprenyl-diphosphate phosphatase [Erysipelotrichaceae bacterium]|nr:undecaprenyl-diphosphate phosphatase [Erysipelotrichaceae bacterium]
MGLLFNLIKSIIYGIIEGITEWLPVSSTAHLIMMRSFMPLNVFDNAAFDQEFWDLYKVVIQLGAILAVLVIYRNRLNPFQKKIAQKKKSSILRMWVLILIACVPTGIAGVLLDDLVDEKLSAVWIMAVMLIVMGGLFIWMEQNRKKPSIRSIGMISPLKACLVGCWQILALIPGTSRSGATIFGETMLGFDRLTAVEFSFFLAIPVMFGASLLKVIKYLVKGAAFSFGGFLVLAAGMITAFVVSMVFIRFMLNYIRRHDFTVFGIYRIALGVIMLLFVLAGVLA